MNDDKFKKLRATVVKSDSYQDPKKWENRGLIPSNNETINVMTKSTDAFLNKLENLYYSNTSQADKKKQIEIIVDELPWDVLDTEEKEFLADTLAPALELVGFNPWGIF